MLCEPAEAGETVEAIMGELSWYHERHGAYVEVLEPATFSAPSNWRDRARALVFEEVPGIRVLVPHPHDIVLFKLDRMEARDRDHARRVLREFPLAPSEFDRLLRETPHRTGGIRDADRIVRFEADVEFLRAMIDGQV